MLEGLIERIRAIDRRSPFGFDIVTSVGSDVTRMALGALAGILLARLLGPSGRGEFAAVASWAGFFAAVGRLSVEQGVIYLTGKEPARDGRWMGSSLAVGLIGGLPVVGVGLLVLPHGLAGERPAILDAARLYLVAFFVIQMVRLVWINMLRGRRELKRWNLLRILETAAWLATLLVGAALGAADAVWYVHAYLLMMVGVAGLVVRTAEPFREERLRVTGDAVREAARFSLPLAAASVPQHLQNAGRLGQLVIVTMADPRAAGLFAVAAGWGRFLRPLTKALPSVVFPYVSGSETLEDGTERTRTGIHVTILLAAGAGVALVAAAPVLVPLLYGSSFEAAVPAAMLLVGGGAVRAVGEAAEGGLRGFGRTGAIFRSELVGLVAGGGAMVPAVARWGVLGAAGAGVLGMAVTAALMLATVVRVTPLGYRELLPTRREAGRLVSWAWRQLRHLGRGGEGRDGDGG